MKNPSVILALAYNPINENEIVNMIINGVCIAIVIISIIIGFWEFSQGGVDESPSKKKHGVTAIVIGLITASLLRSIMSLILG